MTIKVVSCLTGQIKAAYPKTVEGLEQAVEYASPMKTLYIYIDGKELSDEMLEQAESLQDVLENKPKNDPINFLDE